MSKSTRRKDDQGITPEVAAKLELALIKDEFIETMQFLQNHSTMPPGLKDYCRRTLAHLVEEDSNG